ncbi:hypothetical protein F5B22DRAFT_652052 [Xylaria bambusicola]|uniref:uncharacterized protein n=1 Tax=Xylaria bambusicola TaxID=326684 RepID=UPI0020081885|nr:uncharacterized protein F5B22DRAFT_652052 [Xylaria bambusicola]KAI0505137.1 hypothetical protein F5B22DRAFT_652052 [Xylaria bambusicola]
MGNNYVVKLVRTGSYQISGQIMDPIAEVAAISNTTRQHAGQISKASKQYTGGYVRGSEVTLQFLQARGNEGPWHEAKAEFDVFLANTSDITGRYPIAGPSIPTSPEDTNVIDRWS